MNNARDLAHALVGALSILAIGVVLGILLDRALLHPNALSAHTGSTTTSLDAAHENLAQKMRNELGFSDDQANQVQAIFRRHQDAVNEVWIAVHDRLDAAIDSVSTELESVLNPEQRQALHQWLMETHRTASTHTFGEGH